MTDVEKDAMLAHRLLMGWVTEGAGGRRRHVFFQKGSLEEAEALEAMGRYILLGVPIRNEGWSLPLDFREALAACFNPNLTPFPTPRRLEFTQTESNRAKDHVANSHVFEEVALRVQGGSTVKGAQEEVAEMFVLSESSVEKIWKRYKKTFPSLAERPKAKKSET